MNNILGTSLAVAGSAIAALTSVSAAQAATIGITTDNAWHTSSFGATNSFADDNFTFSIAAGNEGTLTVTDYQNKGDIFEVFNNGKSLGLTNFVPHIPSGNAPTPDAGFANPAYSKGIFTLSSGLYNIFIIPAASPYGGGSVALRVSQSPLSVPFPAVVPGVILAGLYFGKKAMQRKQPVTTMI